MGDDGDILGVFDWERELKSLLTVPSFLELFRLECNVVCFKSFLVLLIEGIISGDFSFFFIGLFIFILFVDNVSPLPLKDPDGDDIKAD
jgi:hypothetical protein